jgi:hypothetical protein
MASSTNQEVSYSYDSEGKNLIFENIIFIFHILGNPLGGSVHVQSKPVGEIDEVNSLNFHLFKNFL